MNDGYKTYICSYRFEDGTWGFEIRARSFAEARERVKAMVWASVDGEIAMTIPVPGGHMVERLVSWWRGR